MGNKSFVFRFSGIEVREREFTLIKSGKVPAVEPKAFRALLFLLHNPRRLISKEVGWAYLSQLDTQYVCIVANPEVIFWSTVPAKREAGVAFASPKSPLRSSTTAYEPDGRKVGL